MTNFVISAHDRCLSEKERERERKRERECTWDRNRNSDLAAVGT